MKIPRLIGIAIVVTLFIVTIGIRFVNPGLTETQLFQAFWPAYFMCLLLVMTVVAIEHFG